jgi:hypothetical protein
MVTSRELTHLLLASGPASSQEHMGFRSAPHKAGFLQGRIKVPERTWNQVIDVIREHRYCRFISAHRRIPDFA